MTRLRLVRPAHERGDKTEAIWPPAKKLPRKINRPAFFSSPVYPPVPEPGLVCGVAVPGDGCAHRASGRRTVSGRAARRWCGRVMSLQVRALQGGSTRSRAGGSVWVRWSISPSGLGAPSSATRGKPPDGRPRGRDKIFYRATPPAARLPGLLNGQGRKAAWRGEAVSGCWFHSCGRSQGVEGGRCRRRARPSSPCRDLLPAGGEKGRWPLRRRSSCGAGDRRSER